jgi:hypothetical protein
MPFSEHASFSSKSSSNDSPHLGQAKSFHRASNGLKNLFQVHSFSPDKHYAPLNGLICFHLGSFQFRKEKGRPEMVAFVIPFAENYGKT